MTTVHLCDHGECPALALRHVELFGQDFHFCNHHWVELEPTISIHLATVATSTATAGPAAPPDLLEPLPSR